ncbi:hypothetical protein [Rhizobium laguerreae]|uniref:hypothetical protein n=1 Tax=Rhizobium laguerreae TaxID=1076926 RepID=UPI001C907FFB|nr:hypothetical protein [Rhizobium laguerreae]MBY3249830.1 hypothetical protein [Rhizobium laguerreae]
MYDLSKANIIGATGISAGLSSPATRAEPSAINAAGSALESARDLANRIDDLVNRLCGAVPQAVGQAVDQKAGPILSGLRQDAERTAEMISNAQGQLNRLEREVM